MSVSLSLSLSLSLCVCVCEQCRRADAITDAGVLRYGESPYVALMTHYRQRAVQSHNQQQLLIAISCNAEVTTAIRFRFDCNSLRYDHSTTNVTTGLQPMDYVTMNLMTFDKQSNARRIEVES